MPRYHAPGTFGLATAVFIMTMQIAASARADGPSQEDLEAKYQEEQRAQLEAYFDRRLEASYGERAAAWKRDFSSVAAYEKLVAPWRKRFAETC